MSSLAEQATLINKSNSKDSLPWKIEKLLTVPSSLYQNDRRFIALLLWTRTSRESINRHRRMMIDRLVPWMLQVLQDPLTVESWQVRLLAQVYLHYRYLVQEDDSSPPKQQERDEAAPLATALWKCWKSGHHSAVADLPAAVFHWLTTTRDNNQQHFAQIYVDLVKGRLLFWRKESSSNTTTTTTTQQDKADADLTSGDQQAAKQMMEETLSTLLAQNSSPSVSAEEWSLLFLHHASTTKNAAFWTPLLQWWATKNRPSNSNNNRNAQLQQQRRIWARVLLETSAMVLQCLTAPPPEFAKLVLACVVDTTSDSDDNDDDTLRQLAWDTAAGAIRTVGWGWLLVSSPNKTNKAASSLCALVRLAAGEWKIQIERHLLETDSAALSLARSATEVLVQALQYLQDLADNNDDNDALPLGPQTLLHLRRSLQEALHVTVEFLNETNIATNSPMAAVAAGLYGPLLTEWDIFANDAPAETQRQMLTALQVSLKAAATSSPNMPPDFLSGVTTVLASSEGDPSRVQATRAIGLDPFLSAHFRTAAHNQSIHADAHEWCRQLLELWVEVHPDEAKDQTLEAIRTCLRRGIEDDSNIKKSDLQHLVSCFVTIQGDALPSDTDVWLLQRASSMAEGYYS